MRFPLGQARVRGEADLVRALGAPLLAARPLQREALQALAAQLLEHWLAGARALVPLVSLHAGDGRTYAAAELGATLAAMGCRTLLVDADLRSPSLHRRLGLENRGGLADLLAGRSARFAAWRENAAVLTAGEAREDPLELLSLPRLGHFLRAAARAFRAIVIDTPAADEGPDFEMFAALAGGAVVLVKDRERAQALAFLRRRLARCAARPLAALFALR